MTRQAFILATGADTAGTAVRLAQAFQRRSASFGQLAGNFAVLTDGEAVYECGTEWEVHSMVSATNYIQYPIDIPYSRQGVQLYYNQADLVQLNSTMHGHRWYDHQQGKPTVIMHHGIHTGHFDKDIYECVADATKWNATQVGSTVNLELLAPFGPPGPRSVTWFPTPYDLYALEAMRKHLYEPKEASVGGRPRQIVRIAHAPTDRAVKSTESVILAVNSLRNRGFPVELVLIEHQTHAKTMEIKAKHADILVDQLHLGYGCNAIEAWGLGIPVVGGVTDPAWKSHMKARYALSESPSGLPFLQADENSLESVLSGLVDSVSLREEWAAIGKAHVERHHSERSVIALATSIYDRAVRLPTVPSALPVTPTFKGVNQSEKLAELRRIRAEQRLDAQRTYVQRQNAKNHEV